MNRYDRLRLDVHQQAAKRLEDRIFGSSVRKLLENPPRQIDRLLVTF
jgi:hypothetical protein